VPAIGLFYTRMVSSLARALTVQGAARMRTSVRASYEIQAHEAIVPAGRPAPVRGSLMANWWRNSAHIRR